MFLFIACLLFTCVFVTAIQCPPGTDEVPMTGCEGTLTRVLGNSPLGNCAADFTVWVNQAQPSSEIGYGILSGDFTVQTLTVSQALDVPAGAIGTDEIAGGAVTNAKIAAGTITSAKLVSKTLIAGNIADDTLTAAQIRANAIGTSELSNNAVTTAKITNDAVTSDKLAHSISIVNDLNVGRELHVNGDATFDDNLNVYYVVASHLEVTDSTKIDTIRPQDSGKKIKLLGGMVYIDSYDVTHANSGYGGMGYQTYLRNADSGGPHRINWASSGQKLSLYTEGAIQSRTYIGASDLRIKKDVRDIKDHEALQQIRQLDAKFYKYKDPIKRGYAEVLGFIAQDVNNTIPHAVYPKTDFIPNEMRVFDVQWKTDAETGHKRMVSAETLAPGRYKFIMFKGEEGVEEELTTKDGKTFLKDEDTPYTTEQKYDNVFLYGKEVDDFLTIDKNKIFAVAYAALQEVDRIQQTMQEKIKKLEERLAALESK